MQYLDVVCILKDTTWIVLDREWMYSLTEQMMNTIFTKLGKVKQNMKQSDVIYFEVSTTMKVKQWKQVRDIVTNYDLCDSCHAMLLEALPQAKKVSIKEGEHASRNVTMNPSPVTSTLKHHISSSSSIISSSMNSIRSISITSHKVWYSHDHGELNTRHENAFSHNKQSS